MKRIFLITVLFVMAATVMYAQQAASDRPTSSQTKQNAKDYLNQAQQNAKGYEETLADLKDRNGSNKDSYTFNRLKGEIDRIEATINSEEKSIRASLDRGTKVTSEVINRIESFINQHKEKVAELEAFVSSSN